MSSEKYTKETLKRHLMFSEPFKYSENITLYPVRMKNILDFQHGELTLTLRKDSIFKEREILKMSYLDFLKYAYHNEKLAVEYKMPFLIYYYEWLLLFLKIICGEDAEISINSQDLSFSINGELITDKIFDDIRRIVIVQNDIDFDIDKFMNIDTVIALEKAKAYEMQKNKEKSDIEDYIDSLAIAMDYTEEEIAKLTIHKFWRYVKRVSKRDEYNACRQGQMSGFVTFKEPLSHWMTSFEVEDKYKDLKTDEDELRSKVH